MKKKNICLIIVTPEKTSKEYYDSIILPGIYGQFELLSEHQDIISILDKGYIHATHAKHTSKISVKKSSLVMFNNKSNSCTILV